MGNSNCLVTNILQNIFCDEQKKEIYTSLEQLDDKTFLDELCF